MPGQLKTFRLACKAQQKESAGIKDQPSMSHSLFFISYHKHPRRS